MRLYCGCAVVAGFAGAAIARLRPATNRAPKLTLAGGKTDIAIPSKYKVKTKVIPDTDASTLVQAVKEFVKPNSTMVSDEKSGYKQVSGEYKHESVYHRADEYVRYTENLVVHTNTIEGYWNILKKQIAGIHHFVSPKHLQRYCNENAFRYNSKQICQSDRFQAALSNCNGNLNYKKLTSTCDKKEK